MTPLRLGLDLGTSSVKVVALDTDGRLVASAQAAYPTISVEPGQSEQHPSDWLQAASQATRGLATSLGHSFSQRISAIGLTGQLPTLVTLGRHGPLGLAIAWNDARTDAHARDRLDDALRQRLYMATGMPVDGRYLAPMFRFQRFDRHNDITGILSAKDYLCLALTGRRVTDPSTAAGYAVYNLESGDWDADLCSIWDLDPSLLPPILPAHAIAGPLNADGANLLGLPSGIPVLVGCADSVAAAFAMTARAEDSAAVVMGTSTIILSASGTRLLDPQRRYLLTPHIEKGLYGREMDLLSTGSGFEWLCGLLNMSAAQFEAAALSASPGASGVTFAPYLSEGEQGALWNPNLRGVVSGLTLAAGTNDLARAYFEGIFYEVRRCLDVLGQTSPIRQVVLSGRLAGSPALLQLFASVTGVQVRPYHHASPSAIGAALVCGGNAEAQHTVLNTVFPGQDAGFYRAAYQAYLGLYPRNAERAREQ